MATMDLTKDNFAEWCRPTTRCSWTSGRRGADHVGCRSNLREGLGAALGRGLAKVDTAAEQKLAQTFGIMSVPTLMVFRDQVVLYSQPGALPAPSLDDLMGRVRAVDLDDVHHQIAERVSDQSA